MRRLLITAGPTREPIDAVRFISNRSSGRLGAEIARAAARDGGWETTLLAGPGVAVGELEGIERLRIERFETAAELETLLEARFPVCDVLVMAAAVADYRPAAPEVGKLARAGEKLVIELIPTPDLVARCAGRKRGDQRIIAFALEEPAALERRAAEKLRRKGVDAIVANPLRTIDAGTIEPLWLSARGERIAPGRMSKESFAVWLLERIGGM